MKWHIIGSDGFIAGKILEKLPKEYEVVKYSINGQDDETYFDLLESGKNCFDAIEKDDYVIFLAAISSPDVCKNNYELAYGVNIRGTKAFITECINKGANVLFFSSDVVNGACEECNYETSHVEPFGIYGQMKHEMEEYFKESNRFKVFRLSYVFSKEDKFTNYMCEMARENKRPEIFDALYRNVVYINDIIEGVIKLGETYSDWDNRIFNLSGLELLSRKDIANLYKENINAQFTYDTVVPDEEFFKARPNIIHTGSYYLEKLLGHPPTSIKEAIKIEFKEGN